MRHVCIILEGNMVSRCDLYVMFVWFMKSFYHLLLFWIVCWVASSSLWTVECKSYWVLNQYSYMENMHGHCVWLIRKKWVAPETLGSVIEICKSKMMVWNEDKQLYKHCNSCLNKKCGILKWCTIKIKAAVMQGITMCPYFWNAVVNEHNKKSSKHKKKVSFSEHWYMQMTWAICEKGRTRNLCVQTK